MTHDILQTDIDLALKLRADQRPNEEIILALVHRGVEPAKAAQLLDDLRSGRETSSQSTLPAEFTLKRRSRSKSAARGNEQSPPRRSREPESRRAPPPSPAAPGPKKFAVIRLAVVILLVLAIAVVGIVLFRRDHAGANSPEAQTPKAAGATVDGATENGPAGVAAATHTGSPAPLVLELQPDGLRIGGKLVTGANVVTTVASLLGVPTRTNQISQTGTLIYVYDQQGLLIYSQKAGGTNSIVLDCEAIGGTNGTTSPFAGRLRVEDQVIAPDTDSQTLTAIKQLGLGSPRTGDSVWGSRYNNVDLVFAYLRSPRHLSLIEIDLK